MVEQLSREVAELKSTMKNKEASRDVSLPPKSISDSPIRKPIDKPAVAGVSSKFGLSFYGYFKVDAFHDSGLTSHQEIPFWVSKGAANQKGNFDMTAKETRLGMNFSGPKAGGGKLAGKMEFDFYGNINSGSSISTNHAFEPRTRQAYLNWSFDRWSLLAGKTWEPYIITIPQTLNFSYYNFMGQLGLRKTQVRFTTKIHPRIEWTNAILEPVGKIHGGDIDGDLQDDATDAEFPVLSTKLVFKPLLFSKKESMFGIATVYGKEKLDSHASGLGEKTYDSFALQAGFNLPFNDHITLKASGFTGRNIDSFWGGIGQGINDTKNRAIQASGGWAQLQLKFNPKTKLNLGYSVDNPKDDDLEVGQRSENSSILINGYYDFSAPLSLGLEYMQGQTKYKGQSKKEKNNRASSSIIFKF
jgi:hypothetical protein